MEARFWKASTLAGFGVAACLAAYAHFHPPRPVAGGTGTSTHAGAPGRLASPNAPPREPTAPDELLAELRRTARADLFCDLANRLAAKADDRVVAALIEASSRVHEAVRRCAIVALGAIDGSAARARLWELAHDRTSWVQVVALEALATRTDDPEAQQMLLRLAEDRDELVSIPAMFALARTQHPRAAALLVAALERASLLTKSRIVTALGDAGGPVASEVLEGITHHPSRELRIAALSSLGRIGDERSVKVLSAALLDERGRDHEAAATALAEVGDDVAKRTLLAATGSPQHFIAAAAASALVELEGEDVRGWMFRSLSSSDSTFREAAARYFRLHPEQAVVGHLAQLARMGNDTASEAVTTLAVIGGAQATLAELAAQPSSVQAIAMDALDTSPGGRDEARRIAISLLRQGGRQTTIATSVLGNERSDEGRQALVEAASSGDGRSSDAMQALAGRGDATSLRALGALVFDSKDENVRQQAIRTLAGSGSELAVEPLARVLQQGRSAEQRAALEGIANLCGRRAEELALGAVHSPDPNLHGEAVRALAACATSPRAAAELAVLADHTDRNIASEAFRALIRLSPDTALRLAEQQMSSMVPEARAKTIEAIRDLDPEQAAPLWRKALDDGDESVVIAAVLAWAATDDPSSIDPIGQLLARSGTPDPVRRASANALRQMGDDARRRYGPLIDRHAPPVELPQPRRRMVHG